MKKRLDVILVEKALVKSRNEALSLIINKKIKVNGKIIDKAGTQISEDSIIEIEKEENNFVSRGGLKLLQAIKTFEINLENKTCLDIGASTGGFTDCMLQNGASKVYAIDVGYGQLDWNLRNNAKVINIEKTNFRHWDGKLLNTDEQILFNFVSIDVSFISLKNILPNLNNLIKNITLPIEIIALIKPQFEIGKGKLGKNGVVKNEEDRQMIIKNISDFATEINLKVIGICESPIKGAAGNIEYLMYLKNIIL